MPIVGKFYQSTSNPCNYIAVSLELYPNFEANVEHVEYLTCKRLEQVSRVILHAVDKLKITIVVATDQSVEEINTYMNSFENSLVETIKTRQVNYVSFSLNPQ